MKDEEIICLRWTFLFASTLTLTMAFGATTPSLSNPTPTIAIIDTAINAALYPSVIHEACFIDVPNCPNGQANMDGAGAANVSDFYWGSKNIDHGQAAVGAAILANPKVKIVFIRTAHVSQYQRNPVMGIQLSSAVNALSWIADNFAKYGINAVSISQEVVINSGTCLVDATLTAAVKKLKDGNVPVFAGAGNSGLNNRNAFPACSPDVLGVGASSPSGTPLYYSNLGSNIQLMAQGSNTVNMPAGLKGPVNVPTRVDGTSISTPIAATLWASRFTGTWDEQVAQMKKLPTIVDKYKNSYYWIK